MQAPYLVTFTQGLPAAQTSEIVGLAMICFLVIVAIAEGLYGDSFNDELIVELSLPTFTRESCGSDYTSYCIFSSKLYFCYSLLVLIIIGLSWFSSLSFFSVFF